MTNYERIKSMSVEEMANAIHSIDYPCEFCMQNRHRDHNGLCNASGSCVDGIKRFLESEVETE